MRRIFFLIIILSLTVIFIPHVSAITPKCDGITDDTMAIQTIINLKTGMLPIGDCIINSTIFLGDGTNKTQSTIHDVFLQGQGYESGGDISNQWYSGGTRLIWNGPINGTMIAVRGPIHDVSISKINLDGNDKAGTCIYTTQMTGSRYDQVRCDRFTKTAYIFTVNSTISIPGVAHGNCQNIFNQLSSNMPTNNKANGILLDGSPLVGLDTCQNQFNLLNIIYGGSVGSYGVNVKYADNNNFNAGMLYPSNGNIGGKGVVFTQINVNFPLENWFNGIAIVQGISGTSGLGGNWFTPYPVSDGEPIPKIPNIHYMLYNGTIR